MGDRERDLALAKRLAVLAERQGGRAYFVGGYVRDALLQRENKDIDIEVHGLTPAQLEAILDELGERLAIGESFGIYTLRGSAIDVAMPRKEKLRGRGHRDFDVFVDPFIGTVKAAQRRDFTINAMLKDILTGALIDHFGGAEDLEKGVLRHVSDESFSEDPLRVLRCAQFASRFGFSVAEETVVLCRGMDLSTLSKERVEGELEKALLKAEKPSVFFEVLRQMDQLSCWFPELEALIGVEQDPFHHAEGDVWTHTMLVLDEAAFYRDKVEQPFAFMLAAVTHDFGKALCTEKKNGRVHAYGHELAGLPLAKQFLQRLTNDKKRIDYALNLTELHMKPGAMAAARSSGKATNHLFDESLDPVALISLSAADGKGKRAPYPYFSHEDFFYERLAIYRETMAKPYVMGRDLIEAGLSPGPDFSDILSYAHKLRLAGIEKESALKQTLAYARKQRKNRA